MKTDNLVVDFGKHKGELWTRLPVDYLQWLVNQPETIPGMEQNKEIAKAELDRRGTVVKNTVEVTPHAIDRASLRLRKVWHGTSKEGEGIYTWLSRVADEAIREVGSNSVIKFKGIKFVFKLGNNYPILKTVMPTKNYETR